MKKRVLALFLAIAIIFSQMSVQTSAKTSGNVYGDVNGDEVIDLRDLLTLKKYISEDEPKVYFPDIERPGHNPILRFLSDNLDNPDTKEYLDFMPSLNNKD